MSISSTIEPQEWKIVSLRECPIPDQLRLCDHPDAAAEYWRLHVEKHPYFNPDVECFVVLLLNTRWRVKGHHLVSIGIGDTILVHPREVFRLAIIAAASCVVLMHNHPSGESSPSEADIKVTRDLHRAGQLLKIEVLDQRARGEPESNFTSGAWPSLHMKKPSVTKRSPIRKSKSLATRLAEAKAMRPGLDKWVKAFLTLRMKSPIPREIGKENPTGKSLTAVLICNSKPKFI